MSQQDQGQPATAGNGGIGTVLIDPGAEPTQQVPAAVSGQQESDFYKQGGAEMAEARKWLIGLITSALSFIFGAASKK